jgi:phosphoribosylglycinamide formyltransferase 1
MKPLLPRAPCEQSDPMRVAVLASGQGSNLQALIDYAKASGGRFSIEVVIANREDAFALKRAESSQIAIHCEPHIAHESREEFEKALIAHLEHYDIELVVLAGFMRVLTSVFLNRYSNRVVNVHPALCPSFPGIHAPQQALDHGNFITGCTVHLVDQGVDTGPILAQAAVPIRPGDDEATLSRRIQEKEHRLLPRVVDHIALGNVRFENNRVQSTFLSRDDLGLAAQPASKLL